MASFPLGPQGSQFFWMTYKPEKWPIESVRRMVRVLGKQGYADEPWKIASHKAARPGDIALAFKQGQGGRGIFGVGHISEKCFQQIDEEGDEKLRWYAPVRWELLSDPSKSFLLPMSALADIVPASTIRAQSSGTRLDSAVGVRLLERIGSSTEWGAEVFDPLSVEDTREKIMAAVHRRSAQGAFRALVLAAYEGACAITGCEVVGVLEAAHITPYRGTVTNHVSNGLLLRADLHTLFDLGLIGVEPNTMTIVVSPKLAGSEYADLAGTKLRLPGSAAHHPSCAAFKVHLTEIFQTV